MYVATTFLLLRNVKYGHIMGYNYNMFFLFTEDEEQTLGFNHEHEYGRTYLGELYNDLTAMSQR